MMRIVAATADIQRSKHVDGKKTKPGVVHMWLVDNVRWGAYSCPDVHAVNRHMNNWGAIEKNAKALEVIDSAMQRWGRNNLLDWPTKLAAIVSRSDASSLRYVVEALYTHMRRKNTPDPYGVNELKRIITDILWARTYVRSMARQYVLLFKSPTGPADKLGALMPSLVSQLFESPLAFFMKTESHERDPTWMQSLPNEALRCFMKHALDVFQGLYQSEIRGGAGGN